MALSRTAPLTVLLACALGCATYDQDDGLSNPESGQGGSGDRGGAKAVAGTAASAGTRAPTAGTKATGGTGNVGLGGAITGGSFSVAGTFSAAGTVAAAGTSGSAAGAMPSGGTGGGGSGGAGGHGGAGAGGAAGGGAVGCAAHPIPLKAMWTATASVEAGPCPGMPNPDYCGPASRAIDGMLAPINVTRYTTGVGRTGTEWLQIDFGKSVTVSQVLLTTAAGTDYTHSYEVRLSAEAGTLAGSAAIVSGMGQDGGTTIKFPTPMTGQFLRITQTTSGASWWSIQELDASCQ